MTDEVKKAVLAVLRQSEGGFAQPIGRWSVHTGLPRWKRFLNWLALKLGADQKPFTDPLNFGKWDMRPLSDVAEPHLIERAMRELAGEPVCRVCGGKDLVPDPAGYYCHAENYDGAPLLCRNMEEH
jgi:hypothetical protein